MKSALPGCWTSALLAALLQGCADAPVQAPYAAPYAAPQTLYNPPPSPSGDEALPPLPTFLTLEDCERAYGLGACASAPQVYASASIAPPPSVAYWYMPYAYASFYGALTYGHLAPPMVYASTIYYRSYLAPGYMTRYRLLTPQEVYRYRSLPVRERETLIRQGPPPARHVAPAPASAEAQRTPHAAVPKTPQAEASGGSHGGHNAAPSSKPSESRTRRGPSRSNKDQRDKNDKN